MTPKEKAIELFNKYADDMNFDSTYADYIEQSKKCALIAVNEILFTLNEISEEDNSTYAYHTAVFYNQVKTEIKKL
ncbi:hypothetical protein UFOVP530_10 [uncultured Caudovirales phage]|uniref:Uncharacterized protein n=1 Tax=uncultured Caudovirales phage TaxID=2100421 RepID=A0A6J5R9N0_9CAUD|nr:hypothetical protein UFOVP530_10 [uncultured Caudovirales phage]CAB4178824.1 hypothetical protein UFOVP1027_10 [uncultured Caudovirales phage]CAB4188394.1 hypothetical protein UFOVP1182_28 [uncultured Caudovirales phage]CAB4220625.1 hypothetical protein UFOVP1632_44 [uncultured Caudovirales phage]